MRSGSIDGQLLNKTASCSWQHKTLLAVVSQDGQVNSSNAVSVAKGGCSFKDDSTIWSPAGVTRAELPEQGGGKIICEF